MGRMQMRLLFVILASAVLSVVVPRFFGTPQGTQAQFPFAVQVRFQRGETLPGTTVKVMGEPGEVRYDLHGSKVMAPADGTVWLVSGCPLFDSPAFTDQSGSQYLVRWCGLRNVRHGAIRRGEVMGSGNEVYAGAFKVTGQTDAQGKKIVSPVATDCTLVIRFFRPTITNEEIGTTCKRTAAPAPTPTAPPAPGT